MRRCASWYTSRFDGHVTGCFASRTALIPALVGIALLAVARSDVHAQGSAVEGSTAPRSSARPGGNSGFVHVPPVPVAQATRRVAPIVIDGKLDDAGWKDAQPVTEFRQFDPKPGDPATQKTEFRILFDDDALYIGARMFDTEGRKGVRTSLVRRDQQFNSDYIEIVIDGFLDHLGRALFDVNPSGSKGDQLGLGTSCCDAGWDPVWDAKTSIDDEGWTAEIRIPLSQLRFQDAPVQTWGLQLRRFILRNNELDQWSWWAKNESGGPQRFGHLEGLAIGGSGGRHLELLPYVVGRTSHTAFAPGDPFNTGSVQSMRYGLDLKYNLTSSLTLDATFNPDFGQVEVDPAVINLSAFEVSFPEKRPFFVAGSGVFNFGSLTCFFCSNTSSLSAFYSRRIGRNPTGADLTSSAQYADVPDATTILGAAKITGRTSNGWTIGVLDALTDRADAPVQLAGGARSSQEVEPLANYFVGRVKKDMMNGNLVLGGILTSVVRKVDSTFAPRLNDHSELLGVDGLYTWGERRYSFRANLAVSNIAGDPRDVASRQRSSARYYQRPDRGTFGNGFFTDQYDTTRTAMRGGAFYARVAKDAGDWMWESAVNVRTPGFENNDIAFLQRTDYVFYNANLLRSYTVPTKWYRDLSIVVGGQRQQNWDGDQTDAQYQVYVGSTTPQFWYVNAFYLYRPRVMDDRQLRGGPVVPRAELHFGEVDVSSDSRSRIIWQFGANYSRNELNGWGSNAYVNATWQPTSAVRATFGPSWNDADFSRQYVNAVTDPTAIDFYGKRYVMSRLRQRNLALDTRLSVTFSPTTTLELYAQPFIGTGQYHEFLEFNAPRQIGVSVYGRDKGTIAPTVGANGIVSQYTIDPDGAGPAAAFTVQNPDFNYRSLRGNVVFRWEYRPGSTLYVAWTHARQDTQAYGDFSLRRDLTGLLDTRPDNILLIKASWWYAR